MTASSLLISIWQMFDNTPPLVIAPEVVHYVTLDLRVRPYT